MLARMTQVSASRLLTEGGPDGQQSATPPDEPRGHLGDALNDALDKSASWLFDSPAVLENWQWIGLFALILFGVMLERFGRFVFYRLARRLARSSSVQVDEGSLADFARPFGMLVMAWFFVTALPVLGIGYRHAAIERVLDIAVSIVVSIAGVWAAMRFVDVIADFLRARAQKTENKFDDMFVPLLRKTLKIFVVVVGIVYIVSKLTDDVWKVMAGLSLGTLAVGLAARDSIENLFGTFTVLLDKPFQLGDWITVGDVDGTVEKVGIRSTRVRTFANSIISVPNREFISAKVNNWGARRYRRIKTTLGLAYDTPPEKIEAFCEGVRELIRRHPYTRKDYYHCYLNQFGASALDVLLYAFVEVADWSMELRERHRLFADILRLAEGLNVEFAFPTQTLHMARPEDGEHPDRPASDPAGSNLGRGVAADIAESTLAPFGGNKPGRVKFPLGPGRPRSGGDEDADAGDGRAGSG
ncbi:MAG: mechanosensitive ion channel family protein [bacterium]|nr:mechanosensitive ion channel family protein [bacterium]